MKNCFEVDDKLEVTVMKLDLWSECLKTAVSESFASLGDFHTASADDLSH
jgi:hypothetical protein